MHSTACNIYAEDKEDAPAPRQLCEGMWQHSSVPVPSGSEGRKAKNCCLELEEMAVISSEAVVQLFDEGQYR